MSLSIVRDLVVAQVAAVSGIGRVYGYQREVNSEEELDADLVSAGVLHYWTVSPAEGQTQTRTRHPGSHDKAVYQFDVHGFYAVTDRGATEQTFTAIVEALCAAFEVGEKRLDGTVTECGPLQWVEHNYAMRCKVLCHHARLSLRVSEHPAN